MMTDNWKDITDPEELFRLRREGWEIEVQIDAGNDKYCPFKEWNQATWSKTYLFRARPPQPKMKKIKLLCWLTASNRLVWEVEGCSKSYGWIRVPSEDKEI